MKFEKMMVAVLIVMILLFVGESYVSDISALGYTESAIVYLAAVLGGGCYWIGSRRSG